MIDHRHDSFDTSGGHLALDFVNTLGGRLRPVSVEGLTAYADLVRFGMEAGILSVREANELLAEAERDPQGAAGVLAAGIAFREALWRAGSSLAQGSLPEPGDLDIVSRQVSRALAHGVIIPDGAALVWDWRSDPGELERPLWPIAKAALELLTDEQLDRLRQCANPECGWLFLDTSRNRSRRWCDMGSCGNRAKVRRFREREQRLSVA
jgi:predicted RNA-binding Zn ribbon-like protein